MDGKVVWHGRAPETRVVDPTNTLGPGQPAGNTIGPIDETKSERDKLLVELGAHPFLLKILASCRSAARSRVLKVLQTYKILRSLKPDESEVKYAHRLCKIIKTDVSVENHIHAKFRGLKSHLITSESHPRVTSGQNSEASHIRVVTSAITSGQNPVTSRGQP